MRRFGNFARRPQALSATLYWQALCCACIAALLLCVAGPVSAQSAQDHYDKGISALNAGRYADAVQAFDASYRAKPAAAALCQLGMAYKGLGHPDKALEALQSCVKFANPKQDRPTIDAANAEIERIKSGYARFALKLTPPEATIDLDGVRSPPNQTELWVQTGSHKLAVRASGYETYEQTLDVSAGRFDLEIHLRVPTSPPDQRAAVLIDEGVALQAAASFLAALDKYHEAEAIFSTPRGIGQTGLVEESLGDIGAAEGHIKSALAVRKDPWVKGNRARLNAALARMKKRAATLEVTGTPDGTEIFVNERSMGKLPLYAPLRVAGGSLSVRGTKEGYSDAEQVIDLPPRSKRRVLMELSEAPPPPVIAPIPLPVAAVPALTPPPPVVEPTLAPPPEPTKAAQADVESFTDPRDDLEGMSQEEPLDAASGFEMAINFGYQPFIGGPDTEGTSGYLSPQLLFGARVAWPISFGLQINGGYAGASGNTELFAVANPGFYVRGHIQRYKKALTFDVWAGAGLQPIAMQFAEVKKQQINLTPDQRQALDPSARLLIDTYNTTPSSVLHTVQSVNVPLELGATFYITPALGIDLALGLTFWMPQQDCVTDYSPLPELDGTMFTQKPTQRICTGIGLKSQTSMFIGGGLSLLP